MRLLQFSVFSAFTEHVIVNKIINLKKNMRKNPSKSAKKIAIPWKSGFQFRERQQDENVTLHLSPLNNDEANNHSDWTDLE